MEENPAFQDVTTITLWSSLKSLRLNLWDEEQRQLISFRQLKTVRRQRGIA
jgi:omega-6 fatty acid desaturase (delta-12 desaturase)